MKFTRHWAMPNRDTFTTPVIGAFVRRYLSCSQISIDPFARNSYLATYTNDLDHGTSAEYHMEARDFLKTLVRLGVVADVLLFDPPYSPRQISECYSLAGMNARQIDTQIAHLEHHARLVKECRDLLRQLVVPGAVCLSFGWNSAGMGRGWLLEEVMLVAHGGCHNDTICIAERLEGG